MISMITSAVNVASTFPGLYMVEAWGRRPLLLFGAIGMAISQFIVAGVGTGCGSSSAADVQYHKDTGTTNVPAQHALVAFVCIYIL